MKQAPLTDVAGVRAQIYGLLGALFLPPTHERLASVALEVDPLREQIRLGPGFPFETALQQLLDGLAGVDDGRAAGLAHEYGNVFTPLGGDDVCLPYESRHVGDRRMQGSVAAAVEGAYAEGGLAISASIGGELPDHVGLELQFMSVLCAEEVACWNQGRAGDADVWLRRERAFLDSHLGRWLPPFSHCVRCKATQHSLYRSLADASHAFVVHDSDLVDVILGAEEEALA